VVEELRIHWKAQQEQRLALGLARASADDQIFAMADGSPYRPNTLSRDWLRATAAVGCGITTPQNLIAAGIDILTISRRLGHANPSITLGVYGHLTRTPMTVRRR
jgi:integrase